MDDIDRRVTVLEESFKRLSADMELLLKEVRDLRTDIADLKGYVRALPTTTNLITAVIAIFAAAGVTRLIGH